MFNIFGMFKGMFKTLFGAIDFTEMFSVISSLIDSAVDWFISAFNGISNVFMDTESGSVTFVGILLLISIGLPIVTYALNFLLKLFKGIKR